MEMSGLCRRWCPRLRRIWVIPAAATLGAVVVWCLIVLCLPTDWARRRMAARLGATMGRPVGIESLRLGILGDLRLSGLTIASPNNPRDPWLRAESARIDVNAAGLVCGASDPSKVTVEGVDLRVRRRADGTLELIERDLESLPVDPDESSASSCNLAVRFVLRNALIRYEDARDTARFLAQNVDGEGTWVTGAVRIDSLRGGLNGGTFGIEASVERVGRSISFESRLRTRGVELSAGLRGLRLLAPVVANERGLLPGKLDLDLKLAGNGSRDGDFSRSLRGSGTLRIDALALGDSVLVDELSRALGLPRTKSPGSVASRFKIDDGKVISDPLTLEIAGVPIALYGTTGFDGRVDFSLSPLAALDRLPEKARSILSELKIDRDLDDLGRIRLEGTLDKLTVRAEGLKAAPTGPASRNSRPKTLDDREKVRDISRKLIERILK